MNLNSETAINIACSWSGGKDSCYALMLAIKMGYSPKILFNVMNENGKISHSHGLTPGILNQHAEQMNLPLVTLPSSWENYETGFIGMLKRMKSDFGIQAMVFGDIDIQRHREWEEKVCKAAGIEAILPLWQRERKSLGMEMIASGIESIIVSCNTKLGETFLGREYNAALISEFENSETDACGENGEFHTSVINCPLFRNKIRIPGHTTTTHDNYCFMNWEG